MDGAFSCSVREADFDPGMEIAALRTATAGAGAVVSFCGAVREQDEEGTVHWLELEHYPGMTEKVLAGLMERAGRRWSLLGARVVHRVGRLQPGCNIVLVVVAAAHRREAFCACEFLVDALKTGVPLWKKSCGVQGTRWVRVRDAASQGETLPAAGAYAAIARPQREMRDAGAASPASAAALREMRDAPAPGYGSPPAGNGSRGSRR